MRRCITWLPLLLFSCSQPPIQKPQAGIMPETATVMIKQPLRRDPADQLPMIFNETWQQQRDIVISPNATPLQIETLTTLDRNVSVALKPFRGKPRKHSFVEIERAKAAVSALQLTIAIDEATAKK